MLGSLYPSGLLGLGLTALLGQLHVGDGRQRDRF